LLVPPIKGLAPAPGAILVDEVQKSLKVFEIGEEDDPFKLELKLLRTPPHVIFEKGLGAADVVRHEGKSVTNGREQVMRLMEGIMGRTV